MKLHNLTLLTIVLLIQSPKGLDRLTTKEQPKKKTETVAVVPQIQTSQITGLVTDRSGAVVPGAQVVLEFPNGINRYTTTSNEGTYRFEHVPLGRYSLRFSYPGFQKLVIPDIELLPSASKTVDAQLVSGPSPSPVPSPSPGPSVRPSPVPSPEVSPSPVPSPVGSPSPIDPHDWDAVVRREMDKLRDSKILFNPPLEMQQGKREIVEVRISAEDIGPVISGNLEGRGAPTVESIKVSPVMKVTMTGDEGAFELRRLNGDEEQIITGIPGRPYAEWKWEVTPLESGTHFLNIQVAAVVHIPERGEKTTDLPVAAKPIKVRVDPWFATKRFIGNNWQWLWAAIVVPAAGLFWKLKRKKTRRAGFK